MVWMLVMLGPTGHGEQAGWLRSPPRWTTCCSAGAAIDAVRSGEVGGPIQGSEDEVVDPAAARDAERAGPLPKNNAVTLPVAALLLNVVRLAMFIAPTPWT